jgi:hypothetical protein
VIVAVVCLTVVVVAQQAAILWLVTRPARRPRPARQVPVSPEAVLADVDDTVRRAQEAMGDRPARPTLVGLNGGF